MILCLILAAMAVLLDQITKLLVLQNIGEGASVEGIRGVFRLTYIENKGAAFGILAHQRWVFMVLSVIAIAAILFYLWKEKPKSILVRLSLGMILGGGVGNMIDRIFRGAVIDFIDLEFMDFYVFNIADSFVCVGCALLILYMILSEVREKKQKKESAQPLESCTDDSNASNVPPPDTDNGADT